MRFKRLVRWPLYIVVGILTLVLLGVVWLQTGWGHNTLRRMAISRSAAWIDGELSIGSVSGSVFRGVTFTDIVVKQNGVTVLTAASLRADYDVTRMIASKSVAIDRLTLDRPKLRIEQQDTGWHVAGIKTQRQASSRSPRILMKDIVASGGTVDIRPLNGTPHRVTDLAFETSLLYDASKLTMDISRLTGRDPDTGVEIAQLRTGFLFGDRDLSFDKIDLTTRETHLTGSVLFRHQGDQRIVELRVNGDRVSLPEIGNYVSAVNAIKVAPALSLTANGPLDALDVVFDMKSSAGDANGAVRANVIAPSKTITGDVNTRAVNLGTLLANNDWTSRFTGRTHFTLSWAPRAGPWPVIDFATQLSDARAFGYEGSDVSARGRFRNDVLTFAGRVRAYGGTANVTSGTYDVDSRTFRGAGQIAEIDLRRLPKQMAAPPYDTTLAGDFDLTASPKLWDASVTLAPSAFEGAKLSAGTVAHVQVREGWIIYSARGHMIGLDPQRIARVWPALSEQVRSIDGLLTGDFTIDASGSTSSFATHEGTMTLALNDSSLMGIHFDTFNGDLQIAESRLTANLHADAQANIDRFLNQPPRPTNLNGTIDAHVAVADINAPWRFDTVDGTAVASIKNSTAFGVALEHADVDIAMNKGVATVNRFEAVGPELHATAKGDLALGDSGTSNLQYRIDAADFDVLGPYRPTELAGAATVEGTVTGSSQKMATAGVLSGRELRYGSTTALALKTNYSLELPGRDFTALRGTADSEATFVTIGNYKVDRLVAKTGYADKSLDVDASFEQGDRRAQVAGSLLIHPDHHEVHVRTLQLTAQTTTWQLPAGTEATIRYTPTELIVNGLELVQGEEHISAGGTFSLAADKTPVVSDLVVRADRVRLEHLMSLFLGPNIAGQIDGTVRATGTLQDPHIVFDGSIAKGSVNGVPFESLTGHADWRDDRATVDVELAATADSHFKVSGSMPFSKSGAVPAESDTRPINLEMNGNVANVGLFAPLVPHLDHLSGTGAIALRIGGTRNAPAIDGTVELQKLTFLVTPTGVTYRNVNAGLRFERQRMFVDALRVEDDDGHVMTASGSLDVLSGGAERGVNVKATATSLHILHNQLGEIMLDAELSATGDIRAPHFTGTLDIERARLELDRILQEWTTNPYESIEPFVQAPPSKTAEVLPKAPLPFMQGMSFSVDLLMPENVVVRGRALKIGVGSSNLGNLNATVGGTLHLNKNLGESMTVLGTMDVVRGSYQFQGRQFDIQRGSEVRFRGLHPIDPVLSITGSREITGVTAQVRVTGTLSEPALSLTSDPPLDEGDILSLIMFNRSINRLGEAEKVDLAETAGAIAASAAGNFTSPLTSSVARALDLDIFDITPTDVSGGRGGATVTVGRQVSERLFVGFKQAFGSDETSRLTFEYQLAKFLRLISSIGQGTTASQLKTRSEAAGLDLIFIIK